MLVVKITLFKELIMLSLFRCISGVVLLTGVIVAAGCSWPGVNIGGDKYLLSPLPVKTNDKKDPAPGSSMEIK